MKLLIMFFVIISVLAGCSTLGGLGISKQEVVVPEKKIFANRSVQAGESATLKPSSATVSDTIRLSNPGLLETEQLDQL